MMGGTDWIPDPYCDPEIAAEKPRGDQTPSPDASLKPLSATGPAVRNRGHGPATLRDVPVKPGRTALCPRLGAGTWNFGDFREFREFRDLPAAVAIPLPERGFPPAPRRSRRQGRCSRAVPGSGALPPPLCGAPGRGRLQAAALARRPRAPRRWGSMAGAAGRALYGRGPPPPPAPLP